MTQSCISVEEAAKAWMKDPEFIGIGDGLEDKFALAPALIKARSDADTTQELVTGAIGTSQGFMARLESGKSIPSPRTLQHHACATHTKPRIHFEPQKPGQEASR